MIQDYAFVVTSDYHVIKEEVVIMTLETTFAYLLRFVQQNKNEQDVNYMREKYIIN